MQASRSMQANRLESRSRTHWHKGILAITVGLSTFALVGCTAGGTASPSPSAADHSSGAAQPSASAASSTPSSGDTGGSGGSGALDFDSLTKAGDAALKEVADSTVISIETERSGTIWEVQVVTADGTESELEISADGSDVISGPTTKNEDAADKATHQDRLKTAKLDYKAAAKKMLEAVPDGIITELNLDTEQGKTVWEGDVLDGSKMKHEVQIDAADGSVVKNSTKS